MRIADVRTFVVRRPGALGAYGGPYAALVRIDTDDGTAGWGETDSLPEVVAAIVAAPYQDELMSGLGALLIGQDPRDPAALWARMLAGTSQYGRAGAVLHAMAACDLALWDIAGQAARVPVHRLLGGARRRELEVYATHPLGATLEATAVNVRALVERGFRAIKMGWAPLGPDPDRDEAIVRTMRDAAGPDVKVLVDGGNAWDAAGALERCRRFRRYDVFWLEEPLAPDDIEGYRAVTRDAGLTIAAGELCASQGEFVRLVRDAGIGIVQVDVSRVGLTQAMRIADIAAAAGVPCVNHTYTLDLNLAASLHFMAAAPLVSLCEVQGAPNPLRELLFPSGPRANGATIAVPDTAGLGVRPDSRALAALGAGT